MDLPPTDNIPGALDTLLSANLILRQRPWPEPYGTTSHVIREGDARDLSWIPSESVHLVVTSPPYWVLKKYNSNPNQLGDFSDYEEFLTELEKVWRECLRVVVPGGRICCVVGDVCVPRRRTGRHYVMPLHADIQVQCRHLGFDILTPILWHKITNGATEAEGNGAGFYGKPYQPGGIVKNDIEYILFMRKPGGYRSVLPLVKALSMLNKEEMSGWFRSVWTDISGASTREHPAPYPIELAARLVRMFSFAGDRVLDPFLGTGSTTIAAMRTGRNSLGVEIDGAYLSAIETRLTKETAVRRSVGATNIRMSVVTQQHCKNGRANRRKRTRPERIIKLLTVQEILDEEHVQKM